MHIYLQLGYYWQPQGPSNSTLKGRISDSFFLTVGIELTAILLFFGGRAGSFYIVWPSGSNLSDMACRVRVNLELRVYPHCERVEVVAGAVIPKITEEEENC